MAASQGRFANSKRRRNIRNRLMEEQGGRCIYCQRQMRLAERSGETDPDIATFDHVHPRSKGGPPGAQNIVLACYECNSAKGCGKVSLFKAYLKTKTAPPVDQTSMGAA